MPSLKLAVASGDALSVRRFVVSESVSSLFSVTVWARSESPDIDLEAIVGKALRKNPAERYASVDAFADDLRRHLQHDPVVARQQTFSYRTARFVRRHPGGVSATAAVVLLVTGLTGIYTGRLAAQRNRAQREAAKAIKVSELMMGFQANLLSRKKSPRKMMSCQRISPVPGVRSSIAYGYERCSVNKKETCPAKCLRQVSKLFSS